MHNNRKRSSRTSQQARRDIAIAKEAVSDAEQRMIERIESIIGALVFSVEEISAVSAMRPHYPLVSQSNLADVIRKLCLMIDRPIPEFGVGRKPQQQATRRCLDCGTALDKAENGEYCRHCNRPSETIHIDSESRREQKRVGQEVHRLGRMISKLEKVIDHGDDQGHGGHPSTDSASVETGRREENLNIGSTAAHRPCTDDSGDA